MDTVISQEKKLKCWNVFFGKCTTCYPHPRHITILHIKLCSQYFTAVGCFAQFYRIIPFFALRKLYSNRCFVRGLSTLVRAQCGWFPRYAQLTLQQRLLPENRMADRHQSFLFQRCFSRTKMVVWFRKLYCI